MSQIVSGVGLVILLKVWDGEGHVQVPDVLHRHHLVELLRGGKKEGPLEVLLISTEVKRQVKHALPILTLSCSSWKGCSGNSGIGTFLFSTSPNSSTTMEVSSSKDSAHQQEENAVVIQDILLIGLRVLDRS